MVEQERHFSEGMLRDVEGKVRLRLEAVRQRTDLLSIVDELWQGYSDILIQRLLPHILEKDPAFFEDPNPIIMNLIPQVDTSPGKTEGQITFEDIWKRSPYTEQEQQILKHKTVGFAGFGGLQLSALILARNGIGNFVIADPDIFESTNANRQALAFAHTLGKHKVEVGASYLKSVNSEVNVLVETSSVAPDNFAAIYGKTDVIVDATGDFNIRKALHEFARKSKKPIMTCVWAGFEGQTATFMPEDPLYTDVFSYSPPSWDRGSDAAGISILSSTVARDIVRILLGDMDNVTKYPNISTFNVLRKNPIQIRDVREIKKRNARI